MTKPFRMKIETQIALTFMRSRPKMTIVASLGVMFGIGMYIFMNSIIAGTNDYFEKVTLMSTPHLRIYQKVPRNDETILGQRLSDGSIPLVVNPQLVPTVTRIRDPYSLMDRLRRDPDLLAVSPQVSANLTVSKGSVEKNANLCGVDILEQDRMFDIASTLIAGSLRDQQQLTDGILIGAVLAQDLGVSVGDHLLLAASGHSSRSLRVTGIFRTTIKAVDEAKIYAHPEAVQQILQTDRSYVTELFVNVRDYDHLTKPMAQKLRERTGYSVETWEEANEQSLAGRVIRNILANAMIFTILLVAGFGIYNILNMTIYEKIKEIAILKATGFAGGHVVSIFLRQSLFIGLLGGVVGVLFGAGLSLGMSHVPIGVGGLSHLPITFRFQDYLLGFLFGTGTAFFAGLIPALKASRVDPVSIIRG